MPIHWETLGMQRTLGFGSRVGYMMGFLLIGIGVQSPSMLIQF